MPKDSENNFAETELYKHWYQTKGKSGFLAVRLWLDAGKLIVDIGETGNEGLKTNTACYIDAFEFGAFLQTVAQSPQVSAQTYPSRQGLPTPESFINYGGGKLEGKAVSRIFKVHHWSVGETAFDTNAFAFKAGMFEAREAGNGAFLPNMDKPISLNFIKISRAQVTELSYRVNVAITAYASRQQDWLARMNGTLRHG